MITLRESILKSNSATLDWISSKYDNFVLSRIGYAESDKALTPTKDTWNEFFYIDKMIEYKRHLSKTCNCLPSIAVWYAYANKGFLQALGNILYNYTCISDDDISFRNLKNFIRPHTKVEFESSFLSGSKRHYFYYTFQNKSRVLEFLFIAQSK